MGWGLSDVDATLDKLCLLLMQLRMASDLTAVRRTAHSYRVCINRRWCSDVRRGEKKKSVTVSESVMH